MRLIATLTTAILLAFTLASCNTSEALTPQANVGNASSSSPVTQAETERMAAAPQTASGFPANASSPTRQPQNTLEAQAQALQAGNAVSPASSGTPPQWQGQETTAAEPATAPPQSASLPQASGSATGSIRFLPIIGAPVQAVTPLSRQLGAQARASGLTIRPSGDAGTEHILKGYFSAFGDSGKVTIVYVWDVLDNNGTRLHRMQGQESIPGNADDPWAAVPASTMETIAQKTIGDYMSWRQAQAG